MFLATVIAAVPLLIASASARLVLSDVLYNGTVIAETESGRVGLDAPKLQSITANETSFDWWYFDAVSKTSEASVTVVFYDSGPEGFINSYLTGPYSVSVSGSFANGTLWDATIDSTDGIQLAYGPESDNIRGQWLGSDNASFVGRALTDYTVVIDAPEVGVTGSLSFHSLAPPHYPCGPEAQGSSEATVPHVWWSNAVPDAVAVVDLDIGGTVLRFADGVGYHDKNWGDAPFIRGVSSWYWGHAHVRPYSIVWFDAIDSAGAEHVSSFVSRHGKILTAACTAGAVVVRPWGANAAYPPLLTTGIMQGLKATFRLDDGGVFAANITTGLTVIDAVAYVRTLGTVEGGIVGGQTYGQGRAVSEEFKLGL